VTNTLSYYNTELITVVKSLFVQALWFQVKKTRLEAYPAYSSRLQPNLKILV
jgi:hypothetical protein